MLVELDHSLYQLLIQLIAISMKSVHVFAVRILNLTTPLKSIVSNWPYTTKYSIKSDRSAVTASLSSLFLRVASHVDTYRLCWQQFDWLAQRSIWAVPNNTLIFIHCSSSQRLYHSHVKFMFISLSCWIHV